MVSRRHQSITLPMDLQHGSSNPLRSAKLCLGGTQPPCCSGSAANLSWVLQCHKAQGPVKVDLKGGGFGGKKNAATTISLLFKLKLKLLLRKKGLKKIPQVWELVFTFSPALQVLNLNVASSPVSLMYHR